MRLYACNPSADQIGEDLFAPIDLAQLVDVIDGHFAAVLGTVYLNQWLDLALLLVLLLVLLLLVLLIPAAKLHHRSRVLGY